MKVLVTGSNGQLGNEFRKLSMSHPDFEFVFTDIEELDIVDAEKVIALSSENGFGCIINCAGYTAVDKAEEDREKAMGLNAWAVKNLALAASNHKALLVHISTDYVFDGHHYKPYIETDRENPLSWYGLTKLEGERQVLMHADKALIFRTSWLYSSFGSNFLKTILKKGQELSTLRIVFDQTGTPTYAADLAAAILSVLPRYNVNEKRIYHYSNEGVCTWYDFAEEICRQAGLNECSVLPVTSAEYQTGARRPHYSVLDKGRIKKDFGIDIPHWKDGLRRCLGEMGY